MNNLPIPPNGYTAGISPVQLPQGVTIEQVLAFVDNLVEFGLFDKKKGYEIKLGLVDSGFKPTEKPETPQDKSLNASTIGLPRASDGQMDAETATGLASALFDDALRQVQLPSQTDEQSLPPDDLAAFLAENAEFFSCRKNLKNYFESVGLRASRAELTQIAALVEELEKAAMMRLCEDEAHKGLLREFNELAKTKLKSLSERGLKSTTEALKKFNLDEVGKMSSKEFLANEAEIMRQFMGKKR